MNIAFCIVLLAFIVSVFVTLVLGIKNPLDGRSFKSFILSCGLGSILIVISLAI